jgi:UbiA prenyltransferase family
MNGPLQTSALALTPATSRTLWARLWPWLAYTRPLTIPVTFSLVATGYALAVPAERTASTQLFDLGRLLLIYSVFGWGGANAINSAFDRDTGPVNLLSNPPPMPRHLGSFGVFWSLCALPLVYTLGSEALAVTAAMFGLSLCYSVKHPGRRGKEIGGVDIVINALGSGLLTILLGSSAAGPIAGSHWLWGIAFSLAIFGGFASTQIFQLQPGESYANARNYTSRVGAAAALRIGAIFFVLHVIVVSALIAVCVGGMEPWRYVSITLAVLLALAAAVHSWLWANTPHDRPMHRMHRQMLTMLASQAGLTVGLWGHATG